MTELYAGREGAACELHHNYWEEAGVIPIGEFGTDFRGAATMYPFGRNYFEPVAFSVAQTNCHALNLFSWERGSFGHEHDLRAFARAFRALPRGEGAPADLLHLDFVPERLVLGAEVEGGLSLLVSHTDWFGALAALVQGPHLHPVGGDGQLDRRRDALHE